MGFLKKMHWFEWFLIISILGIHIYAAMSGPHNFPNRWFTRDDAYYYFKVAQNISEGHGSTFDGINLTNGYHPLWMLVCIPIFSLARFDLILPLRVLMVVMALLSAGTSVFLFRILRKVLSLRVAIVLSAFWAYTINVHSNVYQQGMETGIVVLSTILIVWLARKMEEGAAQRNLTWQEGTIFGLAAAFAIFSRLDSIFLALFASLYVLFRQQTGFRNLVFIELLIGYLAAVLSFIYWLDLRTFLMAFDTSALIFGVSSLTVLVAVGWLVGLYRPSLASVPSELVKRSVLASGIGASFGLGILLVINQINDHYNMPKMAAVFWALAMAAVIVFIRLAGSKLGWSGEVGKLSKESGLAEEVKANWRELTASLPNWASDGLRLGWVPAVSLVAYMAFNRWMFGTLMPVSGQIKRWWGSMDSNVYGGPSRSISNILGLDPTSGEGWLYIVVPFGRYAKILAKNYGMLGNEITIYWVLIALLFLLACLVLVKWQKITIQRIFDSGFFLLFCGTFFQVLFYGASGYSAKHEWYWAGQLITTLIFFGFLLQAAADRIPNQIWYQRIATLALVAYVGLLFVKYNTEMIVRMPMVDQNPGAPYIDLLPLLEDNTPEGSLIGMTGGGNVGYFIRNRTVMNMDGLINSNEYFGLLKEGKAREFYKKVGLDYIFASRFILLSTSPYSYQFERDELGKFKGVAGYGNKSLMIYTPRP